MGLMATSLVACVPVPSRSNLIVDTNRLVIGSIHPPESRPCRGWGSRNWRWLLKLSRGTPAAGGVRLFFRSVLSQEAGAGNVRLQKESPRALEGEEVRQRGGLWIQRGPCASDACGLGIL